MVLTLSTPKTGAGALATLTKVPAANPSSHTTPLPRCYLHVWVVGNPTSGGKRGAAVLDRIQSLFCQSFGGDAVHSTSSSSFLSSLPSHQLGSGPSPQRSERGERGYNSPAPSVSGASAVWNATPVASPVTSVNCTPPSVASSTSGVTLRTLIIRTDQKGHPKVVSHALSQLILSSRLDDYRQRPPHGQRMPPTQHGSNSSETAGNTNDIRTLPPLCTSTRASSRPKQPLTHHILLVVGGDGTLSEVTNGLCMGTLDRFAQLTPSSVSSADAVATTSHTHVEREAAVLSHLLPAVLYVPGGTGSDFAKLGLCCRTPEDALHVVRDGLARQLFPVASSSSGGDGSDAAGAHLENEGCSAMASSSPVAPSTLPACAAYAVDIGRIEFLRTGTRQFFINECSAGMSCDVIQRGERFKRCWWISMFGGLVLFAVSALISLLLMTPKSLYVCKLPPRAPLPVASVTWMKDVDTDGEATGTHVNQDQANQKGNRSGDRCAAGMCSSDTDCKSTSASLRADVASVSPLGSPHCLVSLAPFTLLSEQLDRLHAQLGWRGRMVSSTIAPGHHSGGSSDTSANSFARRATAAAQTKNGPAAYAQHARTSMPPSHAKKERCSLQTPSHQVLELLDISRSELEAHRTQQQQEQERRHAGAPALTSSTHCTATGKGAVAIMSWGEDEKQHQRIRCKMNAQIANDDRISEHHCRVNSEALCVDSVTGTSISDDDFSLLTWVELPSSMIAFANGHWYGGGMLVAPHANPTDGLLSCTNWVATILPFILGTFSLYTGRHVHWRNTSAFDGQRFLITSMPPPPPSRATTAPLNSLADASSEAGEALYMEADGEVLEAVPAIVELSGKLIFLVPITTTVSVGSAAPGTTRELRCQEKLRQQHGSRARLFSADSDMAPHTPGRRIHRLRDVLGSSLRRLARYGQQWFDKGDCSGAVSSNRPDA
ncbi:Diacylglycerol_kinase_catalytic_domain_containing_protein (plasmid) [Leishmania braziliensis MHOM/BR/75/M2904]|uniref:Diacylglycerol_kinase_catalytic_domain_containing _protein n=1 Tax=Leishmania braziliensis MHOM/BR/75/M2904 TaxID=420245 RepID=A0A3P3Z459_LEIBR|nr:unnamed protein product [Leishmania braziliensis]SYZ64914.1 Diacylglycerol_kinase_catalytic_domain_containing_protein [Leishmania braziliensis MHOM/BR/75/M2904]